jgi:hypothetical protein
MDGFNADENWFEGRSFWLPGAPALAGVPAADPEPVDRGPDVGRRRSQATELVELASAADLFRTPRGEAYAYLQVDDHWESWPLRARPFRRWLAQRFFTARGSTPNAQSVQDALSVLEGRALFEGTERPVFTRLAGHGDRVVLDLGDDDWRAVEISSLGWRVVRDPDVRFRRPAGMLALPLPTKGGRVEELRAFVNVTDEDWPLLVGSLLAALRSRGPYPVLLLHGEQGSAKSTTARVQRSLVDPNVAPLRAEPRDGRDLMVAANNSWVLAYDNLSHLPAWLSDAFCRLSTGGGFATRALYTDDQEAIFEAQRPLLLTGIEELATRGDLLDRSLMLYLPRLREHRTEDEFWQEFEVARPRILGALLDAVVVALRREAEVETRGLPRMADFARWVCAAEPVLGWPQGAFLAAYAEKRSHSHELTLDASAIASHVRELADEGFLGTAGDLLKELTRRAGDEATARHNTWPKNGRALSGALRRIAPNLRAVGVEVEFEQTIGRSRRGIAIRKLPDPASPASHDTQDATQPPQTTLIPTLFADSYSGQA